MEISRTAFYAEPELMPTEMVIIDEIKAICGASRTYGYRRVGAELRHRGVVVNSEKVRRIRRGQGLQPKRNRRFVTTTDSNHDGPIFPTSPGASRSMRPITSGVSPCPPLVREQWASDST